MLLGRFKEEEQSILAKYKEETMDLRSGLEQDVRALRSIDFLTTGPSEKNINNKE
jgi:hypothetical protein